MTNGGPRERIGGSDPLAGLLGRLGAVKAYGTGYRARCPAHQDSSRSLSIRRLERDGRILLHCFRGCETASVVRAAGLEIGDLFERTWRAETHSARRPIRRSDLRAFIKAQARRATRERHERRPQDLAELRAQDVNAAIHRANVTFGLSHRPIARFAWEGFSPHDDDPLWPVLFQRALRYVEWDDPDAREPTLTIRASDRARLELYEVARRG